jgi:Uma2 family endonuclease
MTTATTHISTTPAPASYEVPGPSTVVPSLAELEHLTEIPERRVVFRDVDWNFYESLVDSIPESYPIHVDYDGKNLELMGKRRKHELARRLLGRLVDTIADELGIAYKSAGETTWKRKELGRGLEADESYYFTSEKLDADAKSLERGTDDINDYPSPDLAIEVDLSPPQTDRAAIYAALGVSEVWRFDGYVVVIDRLTSEGTYTAAENSGFLPITVEQITRWVIEEDSRDESAWRRRLRAEIRGNQR